MQDLKRGTRLASFTSIVSLLILLVGSAIAAEPGTVYVMSNRATGNSVLVFHRSSTGTLQLMQNIATQGLGTGFTLDALASQGALAVNSDGSLLIAVNPGSGDVT